MANMMIMRLKVKQVVSLGQNMVRLILTRPSLKSRIEPIPKTQEQKMAQDLTNIVQHAFGKIFPGSVVVGGPGGMPGTGELTIDMHVSDEEYTEMGRPAINEIVHLEFKKTEDQTQSEV